MKKFLRKSIPYAIGPAVFILFTSCLSLAPPHERRDELAGTTWRWTYDVWAVTSQRQSFNFMRDGRYAWQWQGGTGTSSHGWGTYVVEGSKIILETTEMDGLPATGRTILVFSRDRRSFTNTLGQVFSQSLTTRTEHPFGYPIRTVHLDNGPDEELMIGVYASPTLPGSGREFDQIMAHPVSRDLGTDRFRVNMRFSVPVSPRLVILYRQKEEYRWIAVRFAVVEFTDADYVTIDWRSMEEVALLR